MASQSPDKPKSVSFIDLPAYARKAFGDEIPLYLQSEALEEFVSWWDNNPKVCEGKWYIEFTHFLLVGTDGTADNIHRIGYTPFVGSWEILKDGTITGKRYGVG